MKIDFKKIYRKSLGRLFKKWEKRNMISYVTSFVRHGLTFAGGLLVAKGYVNQEAADAFVGGNVELIAGLLTYVIGQVLSFKKI
jgi:hypothetical protein